MSIHKLLFSLLLAAGSLAAIAVPAKPGLKKFPLPDGSFIEAEMKGDEYFHFFETPEGSVYLRNEQGELELSGMTAVEAASRHRGVRAHLQPAEIERNFPTTGTVRGLIIMAEFEDVKFLEKSTRDYFQTKISTPGYSGEETVGSVTDFFAEQSKGVFTPEFDVVGPVTLPHPRKYYGASENLVDFFRDTCIAADEQTDVDFSRYDVNNDGFVDFVFVIFAGHGEAQGGPAESIWPAMTDLSNYVYDYFDDMNLAQAACSCELRDGEGEKWDGVGTICHEFSHILGLPDIYDPAGGTGYGMAHFDLMDIGTYNGDGRCPAGYTAMDKYTLGWIEPKVLEADTSGITLKPLNDPEEDDCYVIVNPANNAEFYTLENRQPQGFDAALPGHGLITTYVHYDPRCWRLNTVNNPMAAGYEHVRLLAADKQLLANPVSEAADPFPGTGGVASLSVQSHPLFVWSASRTPVDAVLSNITENPDGTVSFDFSSSAGVDTIFTDIDSLGEITAIFDLQGRRLNATSLSALPSGLYLIDTPAGVKKVALP